jgi:hypothetical protein
MDVPYTPCDISFGLDFKRRCLGWVRMALWKETLPALCGMVSWKGAIWFDNPHLGISLTV